jgi:hypothetical protein
MALFRRAPFRPTVKARWLPSKTSSAGTITLPPLKNNTGTLLASVSAITCFVHDVATGALVVLKSGQSSDSSGVVAFSDALITASTAYRVVIQITGTGAEGMYTATAA